MSLNFLKDFNKSVDSIEGISTSSLPPRYWYSTGNFTLNKVMSGSFLRGIPQGRITCLAGPSSSGKSFVAGNLVAQAQKEGAFILVVDSENAMDDDFMKAIGVDVDHNYKYVGVVTIAQAQKVISTFLKGYKKECGDSEDAPQVLICLDSLSMLLTETELENYEKGVQKGDQGQRNKQLKAMLRTFVQDIKMLNVAMVVTTQVYKNQDVMNGEGVWIVSDAVKYSASQIVLLTKLKLRDDKTKVATGIRMKCEGYKTRFTKPFQTVTIEVPYDTGMDKYSGLLEVAIELGILEKSGNRYSIVGSDKLFFAKDFADHGGDVLMKAEELRTKFLEAVLDEHTVEDTELEDNAKTKRKLKVTKE